MIRGENLDAGLPIPPPEMIFLVTGTLDVDWYLWSGAFTANKLREHLLQNHLRLEEFRTVLDFGCGPGRVLTNLRGIEGQTLYGADYNPDLINWARENLPFANFFLNELDGPLPFADDVFDFVYAFSVFTHLTAPQQAHWIGELARVLRPGGYCYLTTHGYAYLAQMATLAATGTTWRSAFQLLEQFRSGELVVLNPDQAGANQCAAFHPEAYVRRVLVRDFEVVDFFPDAYLQDAWLLRNPERRPGQGV